MSLDPLRALRLRAIETFRGLGAARRALPSFMIVGAQKGGTSSLFSHMVQHPRIFEPFTKEIHYFDLQFERGERWYRSHFATRTTVGWRGTTSALAPFAGRANHGLGSGRETVAPA